MTYSNPLPPSPVTKSSIEAGFNRLQQVVKRLPIPLKEPGKSSRPEATRRLRDIPRDEQRPLESRLYWHRKVHHWDTDAISRELNIVAEDLPALAATAGEH